MTVLDLSEIVEKMSHEQHLVPEGNRIYHFSNYNMVAPKVVSFYFTTHKFMFEITLDNFFANTKIFVKYNVQPLDLLRDLWAFKYKPRSIESRLERAKLANKDKLMPWMVRCQEKTLQASLKKSEEFRGILGSYDTIASYIAGRLNFDLKTTEFILGKHPATKYVSITKIKDILDYLLDEAGFTPYHIAQNPRILCHSLETTRERLEEMKKHGHIPLSLVVVCKSRKEYQKELDKLISNNTNTK